MLRQAESLSPVYRHIGLYGYSRTMLETFTSLPESTYEKMEGLEQLRILENGFTIRCVPVEMSGRPSVSGIDSPEDIARAEALIAKYGDL
jgi:3-deoxy-manno-octulosonate cytidylyltransferase (CMP-KDO synthetase)